MPFHPTDLRNSPSHRLLYRYAKHRDTCNHNWLDWLDSYLHNAAGTLDKVVLEDHTIDFDELKAQIKAELYEQLRPELYEQLYTELKAKLYAEISEDLTVRLTDYINQQLKTELHDLLSGELSEELYESLYKNEAVGQILNSDLYSTT